jgi:hypothetical protein
MSIMPQTKAAMKNPKKNLFIKKSPQKMISIQREFPTATPSRTH